MADEAMCHRLQCLGLRMADEAMCHRLPCLGLRIAADSTVNCELCTAN